MGVAGHEARPGDTLAPTPIEGLAIGIAGAPESSPGGGSVRAIARCRELGLEALEIGWVHRVTITRTGAAAIRAAAEEHGILLSVHAPYYVNLNSPEPAKVASSVERIIASARGASWVGASDVVVHLGFLHGQPPAEVGARLAHSLSAILEQLRAEGITVTLRAEVMGQQAEFGSLEDILHLCRTIPGIAPCIDIAHLHARQGRYNTAAEFQELWDEVAAALGQAALTSAHLHLSGIAYGPTGETRHLALDDSDLDWRTFLAVTRARGVQGRLLVESPARERDALLVREAWAAIVGTPAPEGTAATTHPPRPAAARTQRHPGEHPARMDR